MQRCPSSSLQLVPFRAGQADSRTPPVLVLHTRRSGLYQGIRLSSYRRSELDHVELSGPPQGVRALGPWVQRYFLLYLQGPAPPRCLGLFFTPFRRIVPLPHTPPLPKLSLSLSSTVCHLLSLLLFPEPVGQRPLHPIILVSGL